MCLVGSCCHFGTLVQGTVAAGVICVINAIYILVVGGILIQAGSKDELDLQESLTKKYPNKEIKVTPEAALWLRIFGWILIVEGVLVLFVTILLFVAVKTKRKGYLLPWLVLYGIVFSVSVTLRIYRVGKEGFGDFVDVCVMLMQAFMIYLYLVVFSYYNSLASYQEFKDSHVPVMPSMDPCNQPGYVENLPGAVGAMPQASGYGAMGPSMDFEKGGAPPEYPLNEAMPIKAYPQQYIPTPPPYSEAVQ